MHTEFAEARESIAEAQSHALNAARAICGAGEIRERKSVKNAVLFGRSGVRSPVR